MKPHGLPRALRVRSPLHFRRAFEARRSFRVGPVVAFLVANGLPHARVGTAVGKKGRGAPLRNRLRRVLREAWRLEREQLPQGLDWILSVTRTTRALDLATARASLLALGEQAARRLEPPGP